MLTLGQPFAEGFVLSQIRITGKNSGAMLLSVAAVRDAVEIDNLEDGEKI